MKYSKTTLRELSANYTRILKKCAYLNALIFVSTALLTTGAKATVYPADGDVIDTNLTDSYEITSGKTVEFTGANAEGLSAGYGGAIENSGTLNINDFTFTGNTATAGFGGAVDNYGGSVTISGQSSFIGNTSPVSNGAGGAISNDGGSAVLTINEGVNFSGNSATNGGAVYNAKTATITGASFEGNEASYGGGLFSSGTTTITGVNGVDTFKNNNATVYGGAIIGYTGGDLTINNATFTGNTATSYAGGIYSDGTLTIKDSIFDGNSAAEDGAVTDTSGATGGMCITNTVFQNNHANSVGALGLYSKNATSTLDNVQFISNSAINGGSGAAFVGAQGQVIINGATFDSNTATLAGGAIGTRAHEAGDDSGAKLDISKTTFTGNTAGTNGGAISNYLYNDAAGDGYVKVTDSTFTSNSATNGGAVYNYKGTSQTGSICFINATFTDNTASGQGGALYNEGDLILSGTTTFSGNTAGGTLNDIYNDGNLTVSDALTLDGGISGTGTAVFTGGTLTVNGGTTTISNTVENQGTSLSFVFDKNFSEDTYQLVTGSLDTEFTLNSNALFDITTTDTNGTYAIAKKSSEDIAETVIEAGGTANQAATIAAVATSDSDHPVAYALSESLQTNPSEATKAAEELAPDTSDNVMGVAQTVVALITDAATNRIDILGRSGGDTFTGGNVWVQGLYNYSKQDASRSTTGFKANTAGVAFGLDGKVNDALTLGVGYGYTYTHSHAGSRRLNIDGHNVFVYGAYQPDAWYVHTLASYGFNPYEEKKAPMGVTFNSKYDVSTYALNIMTGYDFENGLSPEIGARYLLAKQDAYFDGLQRVASNNTDVLTGVVGVKYKTSVQAKDWTFKPTLRLAATYDFHSSDSTAHVTLPGGSGYQIVGERLKRFGVETGVGLETTLKDWTIGLEYNGNFRKDYQSHTGMLKAKDSF